MNNYEKRKKIVYELICNPIYVPMKFKELCMFLRVEKEERDALRQILEDLEREGKINLSKRGKYCKGKAKRMTGLYRANAKGFGFVTVSDEEQDIFIPEEGIGDAFDGDTVEVVITKEPADWDRSSVSRSGKHREGKVVAILERGMSHVVGLYKKNPNKSYGFVIPDNPKILWDIFIPEREDAGAPDGYKVVVELTSYGESANAAVKKRDGESANGAAKKRDVKGANGSANNKKPEGRIVEILGKLGDPGLDITSIVKDADIPAVFPEKVLNQAERVAKPVSMADMAGRKDIRDWQMITIDGEDAKDLDDAVSVTKEGDTYVLGVHIADVTNYVQENSTLDREAKERGTSVYLADRVIPMLPTALSNGMCSLNEGEDRLALSCIMTLNERGVVTGHEIAETVIHVDKRMSYTGVQQILDGNAKESAEYEAWKPLIPMILLMQELSAKIRTMRHKRGSIDFDFPEAKIILDEEGHVADIHPYERNTATKIIEDFMLMANETVAEDYFWQELPFLYRTHETPDDEKIRALATFIHNFGFSMHVGNNEIRPKEIQKLLTRIEGSPQEALIERLALRSMKQAKYTPENTGHFGLAAQYYTHFTSPIRRYPDLQIHRIIKDNLRGRMTPEKIEHYQSILPAVAKHSSEMERRAEEAERETVKLKKAEYMRAHIGEEYEGVISGMTKWGMYVELENTVEGLVHVSNMNDDHYDYFESTYEMIGEHTRRVFKLGQKVWIRVLQADKLTRTIDFELVEEEVK